MAWRRSRADYEAGKGMSNKRAFRRRVQKAPPPGILAYEHTKVVGWCAIAPRHEYDYLERSRVLRPVDDAEVWSISCLLVDRAHRGRGVSVALLRAAVDMAGNHGAAIVEGYPVVPQKKRMPDVFAWTGTLAAFKAAGFVEVARGSPARPIMRARPGSVSR
jgi:GNAT superfamily N-acetyltransferase